MPHGDVSNFVLTRPHIHPPDESAQEKATFRKELKNAVVAMDFTLKQIYETVALK